MDKNGDLIPDTDGNYFRQWREIISDPQMTSGMKSLMLQNFLEQLLRLNYNPIETRLVMLQTEMREHQWV
jgi:Cu(I)/Ag(I) efflux system membrane protein CusA/SilA